MMMIVKCLVVTIGNDSQSWGSAQAEPHAISRAPSILQYTARFCCRNTVQKDLRKASIERYADTSKSPLRFGGC